MTKKIILLLIILLALVEISRAEPNKWIGFATYYTVQSSSRITASGEPYNENAMTCAIWNLPFNTMLKVTNIANGKFVFCRVNDRGVAKRLFKKKVIIDLTPRAFKELAPLSQGKVWVRIQIVTCGRIK